MESLAFEWHCTVGSGTPQSPLCLASSHSSIEKALHKNQKPLGYKQIIYKGLGAVGLGVDVVGLKWFPGS